MSFLAATGKRSGWEVTAMPDAIDFQEGPGILAKDFRDSGVPLVRLSGLARGASVLEGCNYLDAGMVDRRWSHFRLKAGDILLSTSATLGRVAVVTRAAEGAIAYTGIIRMRPRGPSLSAAYIPYLLESQEFLDQAEGMGAGSVIRHFGPTHLKRMKVTIPPRAVQERIVGILSAYDELIQNSLRRIKILEAMARAIYREWFVEFRFPGHERLARAASPLGEIPKGWEVKTVANCFVISGGGTPSRKEPEYWEGGSIQWFSPSDLTGAGTMFMDDSRDHITEQGLAQSSARMFPARCVMLTSRATIGAIAINTHPACTNQGFITCIPNERMPLYYLYCWVAENVPNFQRLAAGATFKEISRGVFRTIEVIQPTDSIVRRFEELVTPIGEQVLTLQRQVGSLRRTRDLLLPRLLSGQVELEAA